MPIDESYSLAGLKMFERLLRYNRIEDLAPELHLSSVAQNDRDRRALVPIAVIDDERSNPSRTFVPSATTFALLAI